MPFTQASLDFLMENRLNDSREWFKEHRADFDRLVLDPLAALFTALTPDMLEIDPEFMCIPKMGKSLSRPWRDTRYTKDTGVFRENMWFMFQREKYRGWPGFWFEISPVGCSWGLGWYYTPPETMKNIRERVIADDKLWKKADLAYRRQSAFIMQGEKYRRSPYADYPEAKRVWLDQKHIALMCQTESDIMFSPSLEERLRADFKSIADIYKFLVENSVRVEW